MRDWGWSEGRGGLEDMSLMTSKAVAEVLQKEAGEEGDGKGERSEGGCELGWRWRRGGVVGDEAGEGDVVVDEGGGE